MADLQTPQVRFDGLGVTAGNAADGARFLAERLNLWSTEHPNRRILELRVQSATTASGLEMTAIVAYLDEAASPGEAAIAAAEVPVEEIIEAVTAAEGIVANAQQEPP